jgi:hypothetical protein
MTVPIADSLPIRASVSRTQMRLSYEVNSRLKSKILNLQSKIISYAAFFRVSSASVAGHGRTPS